MVNKHVARSGEPLGPSLTSGHVLRLALDNTASQNVSVNVSHKGP